jgi:hypothetical protein
MCMRSSILRTHLCLPALCALVAWLGILVQPLSADATFVIRSIEGWTVHVDNALLSKETAATERALTLLQQQLIEIVQKVPANAVAKLREVPLWFSPEYEGIAPRAEYHPNERWLRTNGRNPAMVKGIEFTNVRIFEKELRRMPNFALHELAHAYHDRVLSFEHPEILAAFERVKAAGLYDAVERTRGDNRANTLEKAYAMSNHKEYFAETTEAFFGRNDFFPFTREELEKHDPAMFSLLRRVWGESDASSR